MPPSSADAPIVSITRGPLFTSTEEGKGVLPVVSINPLPANEALTSIGTAPDDGFFTPVSSNSGKTDENGEAVFTITGKKKGDAKVTFESDNLKTKLKVKVK